MSIFGIMKRIFLALTLLAGAGLLAGCLRDDPDDNKTEILVTTGAIVLDAGDPVEGTGASLSRHSFGDGTSTIIALDGSPSDAIVYGGKVYVAIPGGNSVSVFDAKSLALIKEVGTVSQMGETEGVAPRHLTAYEDKVYVSTYGGYVGAMDTLTFAISKKYKVGSRPEGLCIGMQNEVPSLYVANSGLDGEAGSISVINLSQGSSSEIKDTKLHSPRNLAVSGDEIYVLDAGYLEDGVQKEAGIFLVSGTLVQRVVADATEMAAAGYSIVTINDPAGSVKPFSYTTFNVLDKSARSFMFYGDDDYPIDSPGAIGVDYNTGYMMVASRSGIANLYNNSGDFVKSFDFLGNNPVDISFIHQVEIYRY